MMKIATDDAEAWYPKPHLPATEAARLRTDRDALSRINQDLAEENASLHRLLYEIRVAAGDPEGRLMQSELIKKIMEACNAES